MVLDQLFSGIGAAIIYELGNEQTKSASITKMRILLIISWKLYLSQKFLFKNLFLIFLFLNNETSKS